MPSIKLLFRAAKRMQAAWLTRSDQATNLERYALERLTERQRALRRTRLLYDKARGHGLLLILPTLRCDLLARTKDVAVALDQLRLSLEKPIPPGTSVSALVAELRQIEDEFGGLHIDWKHKVVRVSTEPIALEGVQLGPFSIEFFWERLASHTDAPCFDIVALAPNPACGNDQVTHPHVKNNRLCAGEASAPLRKALEQGRLADAFCLVLGVLTTYNSGSPFVYLDDWSGTECHDCGHTAGGDSLHNCDGCGQDFCDDCTAACSHCCGTRCYGCLEPCAVCEQRHCHGCLLPSKRSGRECCARCLRLCASCGTQVAADELAPQTNLCPSCRQPQQQPADHPIPDANPSALEESHAETLEAVTPATA